MTKRLTYIDIARGIAIICIVLGHLGNATINKIVFTFHVPIFFFITGYFTTDKLPIKNFINNKFKTLIIPYICTCCIIIFLGTLKAFLGNGIHDALNAFINWLYASLYGAGDSYTDPFYIKGIGAIWFLLATFWGSIFLRLALNFKENFRMLFIIILFIIGHVSSTIIWLPFSIQAGMCASFFMYIGFLFKQIKSDFYRFYPETKHFITIFALAIWISFIKNFKSFWLVHCDIGRGIIDIVGCICACYIILLFSKFIEKHCFFLNKCLSFLGKYSIFMLCIHIVELDLFPWSSFLQRILPLNTSSVIYLCVLILCKFLFIIPCTILCARLQFTRKLFGIK